MPRTLKLHIGLPKTGTSSLQKMLITHESKLKEINYIYPKSGRWNDGSHHEVALAFGVKQNAGDGKLTHKKFAKPVNTVEIQKGLITEIESTSDYSTIILSSEFFGISQCSNLLIDFCKQYFDVIDLFICLRRQSDLFESLLSQVIKNPNACFTDSKRKIFTNNMQFFNYFELLNHWEEKLKPDSINIFRYKIESVKDILNSLISTFDWDQVEFDHANKNITPQPDKVRLMYLLNHLEMSDTARTELYRVLAKKTKNKEFSLTLVSAFEALLIEKIYEETNFLVSQK